MNRAEEIAHYFSIFDNALNVGEGELLDIEPLTVVFTGETLITLIKSEPDLQLQSNLFQRYDTYLSQLNELLALEKKQVFNELEKLQLAKKGSARYHDMQQP